MVLTSNRRGMVVLMRWGVVTRITCAVLIDGWALLNAGWICVLAGGLLIAPMALMMWFMQKDNPQASPQALMDGALGAMARRVLCLALCATSLYELSVGSRFATLSVAFSAFDQAADWLLITITIAAALVCTLTGGDGVTGGAQMFRWVTYFLLGGIWLTQIVHANYHWLFPIFGPGWPELLRGSLSVAGINTSILAAWLCMSEETGQSREGGRKYRPTGPGYMLRSVLILTAMGMALALISSLSGPSTPGAATERDFALERLVANGRLSTVVQFPMMFIWFITQIIMVTFNLFTATAMLAQAVPKLPGWVCALLCAGAGVAMALSPVASRDTIDLVNTWRYAILMAAMLAFAVAHGIKQRGRKHAQA